MVDRWQHVKGEYYSVIGRWGQRVLLSQDKDRIMWDFSTTGDGKYRKIMVRLKDEKELNELKYHLAVKEENMVAIHIM